MPAIISVPESRTDKIKLKLSKKRLVADSRVIGLDSEGYRFSCHIDGDILTVTRIDEDAEEGWSEELHFRVYDKDVERVPDFTSRRYRYHGLDNEKPPYDVEEVVVDHAVKSIKKEAFANFKELKKVKMFDNVERIEKYAFFCCESLENIKLSRALQFIGERAFFRCGSIHCLYLPSSVQDIELEAFSDCRELKILVLPTKISLKRIGDRIAQYCRKLLTDKSMQYEKGCPAPNNRQINSWIKHRYDNLPLVRLCANPNVTSNLVRSFVDDYGTEAFSETDDNYGFTPLHILTRYNGFATQDTTIACFEANPRALNASDDTGFTPLDNLCSNVFQSLFDSFKINGKNQLDLGKRGNETVTTGCG